MNRDELLEAADTVVQAAHDYPGDEWMSQKVVTAADELAGHIQRLYDPTPVDEAWIKSVSTGVSDDWYYHIGEHVRVIRWSSGFHLKFDYVSVAERATRGDVRRLCDALGIELREEP